MFIILGLLRLCTKGHRIIYVLLSLESTVIGVLMYNYPVSTEVDYTIMLVFSVVSRVIGLLVMAKLNYSHGDDLVAF